MIACASPCVVCHFLGPCYTWEIIENKVFQVIAPALLSPSLQHVNKALGRACISHQKSCCMRGVIADVYWKGKLGSSSKHTAQLLCWFTCDVQNSKTTGRPHAQHLTASQLLHPVGLKPQHLVLQMLLLHFVIPSFVGACLQIYLFIYFDILPIPSGILAGRA